MQIVERAKRHWRTFVSERLSEIRGRLRAQCFGYVKVGNATGGETNLQRCASFAGASKPRINRPYVGSVRALHIRQDSSIRSHFVHLPGLGSSELKHSS